MVSERIPAVVVTGPVGAGKTTTVEAISALLGETPVRHTIIDMDRLRWVVPEPEGDRFGSQLGQRNLRAIWPNLVNAGIRCAFMADVVESRDKVRDYERAMPGAEVTIVRLHVAPGEIERRLHGRETPATIDWYLQRAPELQAIMEREGVGDIVIDVGSRDPLAIAREIIERTQIVT
jgi:ribose 1,5-bisphosphokinase PhnN